MKKFIDTNLEFKNANRPENAQLKLQYNKCTMINKLNCNVESKYVNYDSRKIINMSLSYFIYTSCDGII